METAQELLPTIPADQLNKIARFLEGQGHKEMALEVATDPEHKFELALALGQLDTALDLAREADVEHKWKTVGDAALAGWQVAVAQECFTNAKDLGSLLLLYSSTSDRSGLSRLAEQAQEAGAHNVAFSCKWLLGDVAGCVEILIKTGRLAEAVLFSQTYKPSLTADVVKEWKDNLEKNKKGRVAKMIGAPVEDEELFPEWDEWLQLEKQGGTAPEVTEVKKVNGTESPEVAEEEADEAEEEVDEEEAEAEEDEE